MADRTAVLATQAELHAEIFTWQQWKCN